MRTFSSSANCVRIPPADLLVDPDASTSRSTSTTSSTPSRRRWKAVAAPRAPPPITTTSAELTAAFDELSERLHGPRRTAAPLLHDQLLEREVVGRRRLDRDARVDEGILGRVHAVQRGHQAGPR